ncbi:MAG TPA: radical SAM family heme chaperone HemW [Thermoanaerobaculia bacterium]|nr:radical SAM family heme chaperone HemW [Thermoanaerobaculia bacterium]
MRPGLYLHIPFCSAICPYCDFAVLTGGPERRARFVEHLIAEMGLWAADPEGLRPFRGIDTIYFGGGTPSALSPEQLGLILDTAKRLLPVEADAWTFLEANPEDVTPESLRAWWEIGVRTLSLGIQSFDAAALSFLGRRHSPEQARRSFELAGAAGFDTVSIDLIYGMQGQTLADWRRTLEVAVALNPDHLSCYQLTIHEGTPFGFRLERGKLAELPEESQAELFLFTHEFLRGAGLSGYEVSNFARASEHQSRHNRKYWDHTPYLGIGPSAHSFAGGRRWWNERKTKPYETRIEAGERPLAGSEELSSNDLALEALMLGLRTVEGIDLRQFQERYGVDLKQDNSQRLALLEERSYLRSDGGRLVPTLRGLAIADSLDRDFEIEPAPTVGPTSS